MKLSIFYGILVLINSFMSQKSALLVFF